MSFYVNIHDNGEGSFRMRAELLNFSRSIESLISTIFEIGSAELPKKAKRALHSVQHYSAEVFQCVKAESIDSAKLFENISVLNDRCSQLVFAVKEDVANSELIETVLELDLLVKKQFENLRGSVEVSEPTNDAAMSSEVKKLSAAVEVVKSQLTTIQKDNTSSRQMLMRTQKEMERVEVELSTYDHRLTETFQKANESASAVIESLKQKEQEVNELVGMLSGATVAGSYAKSADVEKRLADSMRNGSMLLMLTVVGIIGYSLFETAQPHFDWQTAIFRLIFSLTLSVPAAYLARESAKHRGQQYSYASVSLDLQAITPYLASLPAEEQHKLKIEVANRIFGAKDESPSNIDSYPLNIQEIVMALLSRIEIPKGSAKKED